MAIKVKKARYPEVRRLNGDFIWTQGHYDSVGLDLEWGPDSKPSILGVAPRSGVSTAHLSYSGEWERNREALTQLLSRTGELVGHHIIGADIPVLCKHLDFPVIPEKKFDTFIYFWLTNAHLCKAGAEKPQEFNSSKAGEVINDSKAGAQGFMNIWTMASLYTDLPNWKECRGAQDKGYVAAGRMYTTDGCEGPCRIHDVYGYNGIDALAPLLARDKLAFDAKLKRVDHLVPILEKASWVATQMSDQGVALDMDYLSKLETDMARDKADILVDLPPDVNWNSWQQIKKFFKDKYGAEPATTSEEDISDFYDQYGFDEAGKFLDLKRGGKGLKSWFDRKFIRDGMLHPRFKPVGGTSTGRWASAEPNFQNIPTRRSKDVRKIIVARPGHTLYKADYKQAEARAVLYQAGYQVPSDGSFKSWLLDTIDVDPGDPGVVALGGVWNAVKSIVHAGHYGEGIVLLTRSELLSTYYQARIAKGALEIYPEWTYAGKTVCRSGVNLAARMFGRATDENRKRALDLQRRYFSKFQKVHRWQIDASKSIEADGGARSAFGFWLMLYGWPFPKLKTGLAMLGSNPVAFFTTHAVCRAADDGVIPTAQVHDELVFEFPEDMSRATVIDKIRGYMEFEHEAMPGFKIPIEVGTGPNWGEMVTIYG